MMTTQQKSPVAIDNFDILKMNYIALQQVGIWSNGNMPGFLYQDFNGIVWQIEAGAIFHFRDCARATGTDKVHWNNSQLPRDFDLAVAENTASNKKSRWSGVKKNTGAPTAVTGPDDVLTLPDNAIMLDGSSSHCDSDDVLQYHWILSDAASSPFVHLDAPTAAKTVVTFMRPGEYVFNLRVTNRAGLSDLQSKKVTVLKEEAIPVAKVNEAGVIINKASGSIILDGSSLFSRKPETTYRWEQLDGPVTPIITDADKPVAKVSGLLAGAYDFQLLVMTPGIDTVIGKVKVNVGVNQLEAAQKNPPAQQAPASTAQQGSPAAPPSHHNATGPAIPLRSSQVVPVYGTDEMPYAHSSLLQDVNAKKIINRDFDESALKLVACIAIGIGIGYFIFKNRNSSFI